MDDWNAPTHAPAVTQRRTSNDPSPVTASLDTARSFMDDILKGRRADRELDRRSGRDPIGDGARQHRGEHVDLDCEQHGVTAASSRPLAPSLPYHTKP